MLLILLVEGTIKGCLNNLEIVKINPGICPGFIIFYIYIINMTNQNTDEIDGLEISVQRR